MEKNKFNSKFREYAKSLSPQSHEQKLIGKIYQSFNNLLGVNNCIQIGSYPRFTAVTPVNDLDILYFIGNWDEKNHDPKTAFENLQVLLDDNYINPTDYEIKILLQTHSVTILYLDREEEVFSIDIVPAYIFSKNEFNEDTYKVPEIVRRKHYKNRTRQYQKLSQEHGEMGWITSDPRGYIKIASEIDKSTDGEFRKTIKIIKAWGNNLAKENENLKLKSFHLEQVITNFFRKNQSLEIFDAIFNFFVELPGMIKNPSQITERANSDKFIDDYLADFSKDQKEKIEFARDGFLIKLENFKEADSIDALLEIVFFQRKTAEEFLFDSKIKTFINGELKFRIDGFVKLLAGFSAGWITQTPQFQKGLTGGNNQRQIIFSTRENNTSADEYRWKVRNSDACSQPRGEITLNQTRNNPEVTKYVGDHYVECFAISSGVCIARSKVSVKII